MRWDPRVITADRLEISDVILLTTGEVSPDTLLLNRPSACVFAVQIDSFKEIDASVFEALCHFYEWEGQVTLLFDKEDSVTVNARKNHG